MPIDAKEFNRGVEYADDTVAALTTAVKARVKNSGVKAYFLIKEQEAVNYQGEILLRVNRGAQVNTVGGEIHNNEVGEYLAGFPKEGEGAYKVGAIFQVGNAVVTEAGSRGGNHFITAVFDNETKSLTLVDSLGMVNGGGPNSGFGSENNKKSGDAIIDGFKSKFGQDIKVKINPPEYFLHQNDHTACGVASIHVLEQLVREQPLKVSKELGITSKVDGGFELNDGAQKLRQAQQKRFESYEEATKKFPFNGDTFLHVLAEYPESRGLGNHADPLGIRRHVENGADVNAQRNDGQTPLHLISQYYYAKQERENMEYLINAGADVNIQDNEGDVVLDKVIRSNGYDSEYKNTVKLLLENGADISLLQKDLTINNLFFLCAKDDEFKNKYGESLVQRLKNGPPQAPAPVASPPEEEEEKRKKRRVAQDSIGSGDAIDKLWQEREEELKKILVQHIGGEEKLDTFIAKNNAPKKVDELIKFIDKGDKDSNQQEKWGEVKQEIKEYNLDFGTKLAAKIKEEGQGLDFEGQKLDFNSGGRNLSLNIEQDEGSKLKRVTIDEKALTTEDNFTMSLAFQDKHGQNMDEDGALYFQIRVDDGKITAVNHPPLFQDKKGQYYAVGPDGDRVYPKLDLSTIERMLVIEKEVAKSGDGVIIHKSVSGKGVEGSEIPDKPKPPPPPSRGRATDGASMESVADSMRSKTSSTNRSSIQSSSTPRDNNRNSGLGIG